MAEADFQKAYQAKAKELGINPNPDDPGHYYDYRGAYKKHGSGFGTKSGHFPSEFKREGHPNLVVDGVDTRTGKPVNVPTTLKKQRFK